jgi:hypothetical protein
MVGSAYGVFLRAAEQLPLADFVLRIPAKFTVGALLVPVFGQSL